MKAILKVQRVGKDKASSKTIAHIMEGATNDGILKMATAFSKIMGGSLLEVHKVTVDVLKPGA